MTTAMTRSILSSQDFKHQGIKLLDPCPDSLVHLPGVTRPEYFFDLLREVAGQFKGELQFKDEKIGTEPEEDMFTTWTTLRKGIISRLQALACESVQKDILDWKKTTFNQLKSRTLGEAVGYLTARIEDEDGVEARSFLLERADELRVRASEKETEWANEFAKEERTRVETNIRAEAAQWKEQERTRLNDEIQAELSNWATTELETRKKFMLNEMFQNALAGAQAEQIKAAKIMARGMYDTYLTEEQHKLWPEVPDLAQQGGFDEALSAEREKLYKGIREQANREVKEEVAAYKANRIATTTRQMEESIQREEADMLRIAAHKLGFDLTPAERVPKTVKRSRDEPSAPKKPRSETAKAAMAATIPVTGNKRTAEGKVHTPATPKALLPPAPGDNDHPMIVETDSESPYTNSDRFEKHGVIVRVISPVSEAPEPPLNIEGIEIPNRTIYYSDHSPEGKKILFVSKLETTPPEATDPAPPMATDTAPPMEVDPPIPTPAPAPPQDALTAILTALQGFRVEVKKEIAGLGERITAIERGERIPEPVPQTKPSAPKAAPPVSILKRPQPAAVPMPPTKAVAKGTPPHIPAAKATTAAKPVDQGKASGSPPTIPVTQTPTVPKPLEGEVKDAGPHIIVPAVGADADLEPVQGRVDDTEEFPALPTRGKEANSGLSRHQRWKAAMYQKALARQREGPPGSAPPPTATTIV